VTINGTNFLSNSTVTFNGMAHTPTIINSSRLTIVLNVSDLAIAGSYSVVVTNPAPGGGASNSLSFIVQTSTLNPFLGHALLIWVR